MFVVEGVIDPCVLVMMSIEELDPIMLEAVCEEGSIFVEGVSLVVALEGDDMSVVVMRVLSELLIKD